MSTVQQFFPKLGAGLFALVVIGGVYGLLTMSLFASQARPSDEVAQFRAATPVMESVTVTGTRRVG